MDSTWVAISGLIGALLYGGGTQLIAVLGSRGFKRVEADVKIHDAIRKDLEDCRATLRTTSLATDYWRDLYYTCRESCTCGGWKGAE